MESQKAELLALLTKECEAYAFIPSREEQQRREKKCFINGLMTAGRIMGISFDELKAIVDLMPKQAEFKDLDEQLSIPTYVRNKLDISL